MYIIQELQTVNGATIVTPAVPKASKNEAESAYYLALGAAAVSSVPLHAVVMIDDHGEVLHSGYYEHPAPETA